MSIKEFEFIDKYLAKKVGVQSNVKIGIGDDAAVLNVPSKYDLVMTTDTLVSGVHFDSGISYQDLGHKSLAVNLSDLAAMGANPVWASLCLTIPKMDEKWIKQFCKGFFSLLKRYNMQLIGGDTTRGPLSITVQAYGFVPKGKAILRNKAKVGDNIYVTGNLGDAGLALEMVLQNSKNARKNAIAKFLDHPEPRINEGLKIRNVATSAIDISDGLAQDLNHILKASKVGATIYTNKLPLSKYLQKLPSKKSLQLALTSGDDYELCFTSPNKNIRFTKIGVIESELGLRIKDNNGKLLDIEQLGYEHEWKR